MKRFVKILMVGAIVCVPILPLMAQGAKDGSPRRDNCSVEKRECGSRSGHGKQGHKGGNRQKMLVAFMVESEITGTLKVVAGKPVLLEADGKEYLVRFPFKQIDADFNNGDEVTIKGKVLDKEAMKVKLAEEQTNSDSNDAKEKPRGKKKNFAERKKMAMAKLETFLADDVTPFFATEIIKDGQSWVAVTPECENESGCPRR